LRKQEKKFEKTKIFSSNDEELDRKILEKESVDILLLNQSNKKDKLKQRDSGFNHVMAKTAKEKNITIGINLDEIIHSDKRNRAKILGRVRQNIELCKKVKLKMMFFSEKEKRNSIELKALGSVLGMPTNMIKDFQ
jgi:ribonuclease P/MRP protein subunit RPP1